MCKNGQEDAGKFGRYADGRLRGEYYLGYVETTTEPPSAGGESNSARTAADCPNRWRSIPRGSVTL